MILNGRDRGSVEGFSCDGCIASYDLDMPEDFSSAWASAKAEGWRSEKTRDGWEHYCRDCVIKRRAA